jgi:hypothetical protein
MNIFNTSKNSHLTANKDNNGVESSPWEGPRDPGCGARVVTLFQELKNVKHLFWKVFESFGSVCVYTHSCVYTWLCAHASSGSAYWGLLYPWKTFPENIYFLLCTRTTQPHRIARQYFRCLEFVDNINHIRRIQIEFQTKFLTTLWAFEI